MNEGSLTPKMQTPLKHAVVVMEYQHGEPWPVMAFEIREDGHMAMKGTSRAGLAMPLLIAAAQRCAAALVLQEMKRPEASDGTQAEQSDAQQRVPTNEPGAD